jgi:hypothetical protein
VRQGFTFIFGSSSLMLRLEFPVLFLRLRIQIFSPKPFLVLSRLGLVVRLPLKRSQIYLEVGICVCDCRVLKNLVQMARAF